MIKRKGVILEFDREDDIQNVNCVIIMISIFIIINILIDGLSELNLNGSKAEKISGIIQNMEDPYTALKAVSLFNLMFC